MSNCSCHLYKKDELKRITYPDCAVHGKGGTEPAYARINDFNPDGTVTMCGREDCQFCNLYSTASDIFHTAKHETQSSDGIRRIMEIVRGAVKATAESLRPPNACPLCSENHPSTHINAVMCPHNILIQQAFDRRLAELDK